MSNGEISAKKWRIKTQKIITVEKGTIKSTIIKDQITAEDPNLKQEISKGERVLS